jgi:hypothetical protein
MEPSIYGVNLSIENIYPLYLNTVFASSICLLSPSIYNYISVPYRGVGRCLGPEGNGVNSGEGGEGGQGPPDKERDKQSSPRKEGGNMEQE